MDTRIFGKFLMAFGFGASGLLAAYLVFGLEKWRFDEELRLIYAMYETIPTLQKKLAIEEIRLGRERLGGQLTWCAVGGAVVGVIGLGLFISSPRGVARPDGGSAAEGKDPSDAATGD